MPSPRSYAALGALAGLLLSARAALAVSCGTTLDVAGSGAPFTSIQAAVAAIPTSLTTDYCVVVRDTGTYAEQVSIRGFTNNGYRLTIMADASFVSSAPAITPPVGSTAAFHVQNDSVTISNFVVPLQTASTSVAYGVLSSSAFATVDRLLTTGDASAGAWNAGVSLSSWSTVMDSTVTAKSSATAIVLGGTGAGVLRSRAVGLVGIRIEPNASWLEIRGSTAVTTGSLGVTASSAAGLVLADSYVQGDVSVFGSTGTEVVNSTIGAVSLAGGCRDLHVSSSVVRGNIATGAGTAGDIRIGGNAIYGRAGSGTIDIESPAPSASVIIASNMIVPVFANTNGSTVYGIRLFGLPAGATIQSNSIFYRPTNGTVAYTAFPYGSYSLWAENSPGLVIERNRFANEAYTAGNNEAVRLRASPNTVFRFNDVYAKQHGWYADSSPRLSNPNAIVVEFGSTGFQLTSNVIHTSYTISSLVPRLDNSSATLVVSVDSMAGLLADYNSYWDQAGRFYWRRGTARYVSLAAWTAATGLDSHSQVAAPLWKSTAPHSEDFHPLSIRGRYDAGAASFVADPLTSATIDAADPAAAFAEEPAPNGGRANQGSYGGTSQASLSAIPPANVRVASVFQTSITVAWDAGATNGFSLQASTGAGFVGPAVSSTSDGGSTQLTLTGLLSNATYLLRVGAIYPGGTVFATPSPGSTTTLIAPPASAGPSEATATRVAAFWGANGNADQTQYEAEISTNGFVSVYASSVTRSTFTTFSGLFPERSFDLRVRGRAHNGAATPYAALPSTRTLALASQLGDSWTAETNVLPDGRSTHGMAAWDGRIYVSGGSRNGGYAQVGFQTAVSSDGMSAAWSTSTNHHPLQLWSVTMVAAKARLYSIGGVGANGAVYQADLAGDGSVGVWSQSGSSLPPRAYHLAAAVWRDTIYVSGGTDNGTSLTYKSRIAADGSLGTWTNVTPLPLYPFNHAMFASHDRLFFVGGTRDAVAYSDVWAARILPNGDLGPWVLMGHMPEALSTFGMAACNDFVYVVGGRYGYPSMGDTGNVAFSRLQADGGLSVWQSTGPAMPVQRNYGSAAVVNGRLFQVAGAWSSTGRSYPTVYSIPLLGGKDCISLSGVARTSGTIEWSWPDLPSETAYSIVTTTGGVLSGALPPGTTFWLEGGLSPNAPVVRALSAATPAGTSTSAFVSRYTLAAVPTGITVQAASSIAATISWSNNGNPGATVYEVFASTDGFASWSFAASTTTLVQPLTGLLPATTYQFRVRALNQEQIASANSAAASTVTELPLPGPPGTPVGTAVGISSLTWSWTAASAAGSYSIRPSTEPETILAESSTDTFTLTGLPPNTTFSVMVAARNGTGQGPSSLGSAAVYTLARPPSGTSAAQIGYASATISWSLNGNPAATLAQVESSTDGITYGTVSTTSASSFLAGALSCCTTYYHRVRFLNGDGVPTDYDAFVSLLTRPGAPAAPVGTAVGSSSITWTWAAASGVDAYSVRPSTEPATVLGETSTRSFTAAGLAPNTTYSIVIAGRNSTGEGPVSASAAPVHTLAKPPSGTTVMSIGFTSATLQWTLNGNPPGTPARVERSADGASFTVAATTPTSAFTDTALAACSTYYFRIRHLNGEGFVTEPDSTVALLTKEPVPPPASGLQAEPLTGGRVALSWLPAASTGVAQYRLYSDGGGGAVDFAAPLAVLTSTETSFTTGVLASSAAYRFSLRSKGSCGVEETLGVYAVSAATANPSAVRAIVKAPDSGKRINGNRVTLIAELAAGSPSSVSQITFQSRALGPGAWSKLTVATVDHPNPDVGAPYFIHVDVTGWAPGDYELRAMALDVAGSSDSAPSAITVTVDPLGADIQENLVGGRIEKQQRLSRAAPSSISAAGAGSADPSARIALPAGVLPASSATMSVVCGPALTTAVPSGYELAGPAVQVRLSDGLSQLGGMAAVTLSYPEGFARPSDLKMQALDESTGRWELLGSSSLDAANRTFTAQTSHFSIFALVTGGQAAADLNGIRVFPNPFKPNDGDPDNGSPYSAGDPDSGITFDNLPRNVTITIFTLTGREVAKLAVDSASGRAQWDVRGSDGKDVASGGYLAVLTSPGSSEVVKRILVIR